MIVPAGDTFPNGAQTPADCHRFCRCDAYELSIPTDGSVHEDDLDGADSDSLIALYAIGYLASRHDRDVATQQATEAAQPSGLSADDLFADTSDGDDDDDEDATASAHDITPVVLPPPAPVVTPKPRRR